MNILSIDCSNGLYVYLSANSKDYYKLDTTKKQSGELLTSIDSLLSDAKLKIADIDVIAVNIGPGSFTGIRVALSTAKGLAIGCKAKVVTYTSFDTIQTDVKNHTILVEGFGENIYYKVKKFGREFFGCNNIEEIESLIDGTQILTNSANLAQKYEKYGIKLADYDVKTIIFEKIEKQNYSNLNQIAPLYLRASQAEIERLKHGK